MALPIAPTLTIVTIRETSRAVNSIGGVHPVVQRSTGVGSFEELTTPTKCRYARGDREHDGHRNGYSPVSIKTTAGEVTLQGLKTRGTDEAFASRLLGAGVTRTNALESLVIAGFMRGLSVRDVEASLADALVPESTVSKSTVDLYTPIATELSISTDYESWEETGSR